MKFFHTLREKEFTRRALFRGNPIPLIKYILYRMGLSPLFWVRRKWYRMRVWYAPLAFWLWTRTEKNKSDELFYETFLKPGDIVIDCGAHLGTLAITASKLVGKDGHVLACEMHPRTYRYLTANLRANGCVNVKALNVAVGDKTGTMKATDEYVSDINHINDDGVLTVPMLTLDDLAGHFSHVNLLKLDIEGYEFHALRGAHRMLAKVQAVYFEAAPRNFARYDYTVHDILRFLLDQKFSLYAFDENNIRFPIDEHYIPTVKYENILALREMD